MYFVPFFFVLNPALILQGTAEEVIIAVSTAVCGVAAIAWSLQGYMLGVGGISNSVRGIFLRIVLMAAGLILAAPGSTSLGITQLEFAAIGLTLIVLSGLAIRFGPGFSLAGPLSPSPAAGE